MIVSVLAVAVSGVLQAPAMDMDPGSGAWTGLRVHGRQIAVGPVADVGISFDGGELAPLGQWRLVNRNISTGRCSVTRRAGQWEVTTITTLSSQELRRSAVLRWHGAQAVKVRGAVLRTPILRISSEANDWYAVPGNFPVVRRRFVDLLPGRETAEAGWTRGDYGMAVVHSPRQALSVVAAYQFTADQARVRVEEHARGISIAHLFDTLAEVKPGGELALGTQVLRFTQGREAELLHATGALAGAIGNGPPADQPRHLAGAVLYEVHPWGRLESWGSGDRGSRYPRLASLTPYYRDLGVTGLWLLPVAWPPPWVYTLPAFDRVAPENGTADQLKGLVRAAHSSGLKVLIDLVVYGIQPSSPEVARHPEEVWCHDEKGERAIVWGGTVLAADCSNPLWQRRIAEVCTAWARDFGFDGTRMDCIGWGQTVNWRHPSRANAPIAYGGLQLNKVVRDAMRAANPEAVTLPEGGKPLVFRNADMVFDYPWYLAMRDMTREPDLAAWVRDAREWLQWERLAYPAAARKGIVRFLELHDTVSAAEYFGVGPSQALAAICSLMEGTLLLQQEQETGFSEDLSRWLHLRRQYSFLASGSADYMSVTASAPGVLAFLRRDSHGAALVAVNLTGRPVDCTLRWPRELNAQFPLLGDAISGRKVPQTHNSARVRILGYRPRVLVMLPAGTRTSPPRALATRGARWSVETPEGVLRDAFRPLAAPVQGAQGALDVLPVLSRAWRPVAGGLMDGGSGRMAIVGKDGRRDTVDVDPSLQPDARIEDRDADGAQARIVASRPLGTAVVKPVARGSAKVTVDAQFVTVQAATVRLVLARRHGGLPIGLFVRGSRESLIGRLGDVYSDWGLHTTKDFISVDGDTNPRLSFTQGPDGARVSFRGVLRGRAWNGVQTCPIVQPSVAYRLTYTVRNDGEFSIEVGVTPSRDIPDASAFLAIRLPVEGVVQCRRGGEVHAPVSLLGQRLCVAGGSESNPIRLITKQGDVVVRSIPGAQRSFYIADAPAAGHLFLCALDGERVALRAGQEWHAGFAFSLQADASSTPPR